EGSIVAIGFPAAHFASNCLLIEDIDDLKSQSVIDRIAVERVALQNQNPGKTHGFAFLLVDGLSMMEDTLAATISPALRDLPLFGGSAGDGTDFGKTRVALNGAVRSNAAVLSLVRTDYETRVFSLNHLVPQERQMVVTEADPDRRIVKTINAEPAAREYARIVGKDPEQLDQFTFASHPVVVRIGNTHHVRAIQQVNAVGELVFFSAIDEGMVLTVAEPLHMAEHLEEQLTLLSDEGRMTDIIGCDCLLRRIEAEQKQMSRAVSDVLSRHNVMGFSTYGEQIGPLHVNQTMSGVAIYAPEASEE
ncbi:MAG: FIST N-terminal domain-containing protein, partial [Pseudomonadota bacterium]